jgi:quaternary ammonium compound-resistance protein SugE
MPWFYLVLAGAFEVCWTIALKFTDGLSKPVPVLLTGVFSIASLACLGLALKSLPIGTAYAVWTGIGTIGTVLLGVYLFDEPATASRALCIGLIAAGIVALRLVS